MKVVLIANYWKISDGNGISVYYAELYRRLPPSARASSKGIIGSHTSPHRQLSPLRTRSCQSRKTRSSNIFKVKNTQSQEGLEIMATGNIAG